ncbi:hypothetical protein [Cognatitamlana onchidii]|nr:hypothetical protein [Algibacter onchidii]
MKVYRFILEQIQLLVNWKTRSNEDSYELREVYSIHENNEESFLFI